MASNVFFDFYSADIGRTRVLPVGAVSAALPANERLEPGRYLLQLRGAAGIWAWVLPFSNAITPAPTAVPAVSGPAFPMSADGVLAIEINVRPNHNDRIAAVTEAGLAILYITKIGNVTSRQ